MLWMRCIMIQSLSCLYPLRGCESRCCDAKTRSQRWAWAWEAFRSSEKFQFVRGSRKFLPSCRCLKQIPSASLKGPGALWHDDNALVDVVCAVAEVHQIVCYGVGRCFALFVIHCINVFRCFYLLRFAVSLLSLCTYFLAFAKSSFASFIYFDSGYSVTKP